MKRGYRLNNAYAYYSYRSDKNTANFGILQAAGGWINPLAQRATKAATNLGAQSAEASQALLKQRGAKDWVTAGENGAHGFNTDRYNRMVQKAGNNTARVDALNNQSNQFVGNINQANQAQQKAQRWQGISNNLSSPMAQKVAGGATIGAGALGVGVGANALMNNGNNQYQ